MGGALASMFAETELKKVELAGGFMAGDVVESLVDHSNWLRKNDEGVVVGPSKSGRTTRVWSTTCVLVRFSKGQAINMKVKSHIRKKTATSQIEDLMGLMSFQNESSSIISHTHGRERRLERGIGKEELKAAVKQGHKERANAGRDGSTRWKYTHNGVVFVTDETSRHEITSWRLDAALGNAEDAEVAVEGSCRSHTVLIVDHSGSMRKADVPAYASRTEAVIDCLIRDFVRPQIEAKSIGIDAVASLILMSDEAEIVFQRQPFDESMLFQMERLKHSRARSHGNYLPALDMAIKLLQTDTRSGAQLFLMFLSDGAPSDHCHERCLHGVQVWQESPPPDGRTVGKNGGRRRMPLQICLDRETAKTCRSEVRQQVRERCAQKVKLLGDLFGRDRTYIGTVAFGPITEDYQVLQDMAAQLPRQSFQKLGLNALGLKTAFSSLTSDLSTMNTQMMPQKLTVRKVKQQEAGTSPSSWDIYIKNDKQRTLLKKYRWDIHNHRWRVLALPSGVIGVAHSKHFKAKGAERLVYDCIEINDKYEQVGDRLIAKEALHKEFLGHEFHKRFCRNQCEAEAMAEVFNRRLGFQPEWQLHFLQCVMYDVMDERYEDGVAYILAEKELEGAYTKWNNNGGTVRDVLPLKAKQRQQSLDDEIARILGDSGGDDDGKEDDDVALLNQVPQCFSHFTYIHSDRKKLVCDLQGVWNKFDGFTLTDPVFHSVHHSKKNGQTDKGIGGMQKFFETHKCGSLCRSLGLDEVKPSSLG
jgi:hypothetical protein